VPGQWWQANPKTLKAVFINGSINESDCHHSHGFNHDRTCIPSHGGSALSLPVNLGSFYARATAADMPDADKLTGSIIRAHFLAKRLRKRGLKCWAGWSMSRKFRFPISRKSDMKWTCVIQILQ